MTDVPSLKITNIKKFAEINRRSRENGRRKKGWRSGSAHPAGTSMTTRWETLTEVYPVPELQSSHAPFFNS